jgi:hypothetical protein
MPEIIVILNITLWISSALLFRELVQSYLEDIDGINPNLIFTILLLSPTPIYWSGTFLKDITSTFLCILAAYLFFRKRYTLLILVIVYATLLRPYSIAIVGIYISILAWSPLLLISGFIMSIIFMLLYTGEFVTVLNSILIFGYFFVSPNPVDPNNWTTIRLIPRLLEAVFYAIVLSISGIYALANQKLRNQYILLSLGIFIYSFVMVTVAYRYTVFVRGLPYGFGTAGENILRKMLPMIPIIALWIGQTLSHTNISKFTINK